MKKLFIGALVGAVVSAVILYALASAASRPGSYEFVVKQISGKRVRPNAVLVCRPAPANRLLCEDALPGKPERTVSPTDLNGYPAPATVIPYP